MMKYLFIMNPHAGRKKKTENLLNLIDSYMSTASYTYEFAYTSQAGDATRIASQAVNEGFNIVVAVGGDGTVNEVASGLINEEGHLGIVPMGSGNGIARSLKIPITTKECLQFLLFPEMTTIDVGMIGKNYFVGVAGIGYDALVGEKFQNFGVRGPVPYFFIGVNEFLKYRSQTYCIEIDGKKFKKEALVIALANTRQYGNGAIISPISDPRDGFIDVCIIEPLTYLQATQHAWMLFKGNIDASPLYYHKKCKSVRIYTKNLDMPVHRDGEPCEPVTAVDVKIVEKALKVCAPL
jgi:YegS/Rv2252/BmrU family lipid kinase